MRRPGVSPVTMPYASQGVASGPSGDFAPRLTNVVYVDPNNPDADYATLQDAIDGEFGDGNLNVLFEIGPNVTYTEDLVFPDGVNYEISCPVGTAGLGLGGRVTGNITIPSAVAQTVVKLTNISLTGGITGTTSFAGGSFLVLFQCKVSGDITLSGTGSGFWFLNYIGAGDNFFSFSGNMSGDVTVTGQLQVTDCDSTPAKTWQAGFMFLENVRLPTTINVDSTSVRAAQLIDCLVPSGPVTINGIGGIATITADPVTVYELNRTASVLVSATLTLMSAIDDGSVTTDKIADGALTPIKNDSVDIAVSQVNTNLIVAYVLFTAGVNDAPLQFPFKWRFVDCITQTTTAGAGGSVCQWKTASGGGGSNLTTTMATSSTTTVARNNGGGNLVANQIVAANTDIFLNKTDNAAAGVCIVYAMRID